jgi:hypothetical protein
VPPEPLVSNNTLITKTPEEGRALAITLARHTIHAMQKEAGGAQERAREIRKRSIRADCGRARGGGGVRDYRGRQQLLALTRGRLAAIPGRCFFERRASDARRSKILSRMEMIAMATPAVHGKPAL